MPVYILITGGVFALALRNTTGSILSPLAALAPWVMMIAAAMALLLIVGVALRWRRRLGAVRRVRAARGGAGKTGWEEDGTGVVHHPGPG
ncbi:hypothetical protein [Luteimonas terrae]|uniref:Uncharacterized protein n=1 Tax=Luteimonas terrae TaxID=1530191 RepID=A0ABU1XVA0_9GAMM|nr:hypothetical protein [Luteimonas terrae]MDR7192674.1 hypothetical protein [Luteimonas terrae]